MTDVHELRGITHHFGKLTESVRIRLTGEDMESLSRLAAERRLDPGALARTIIAWWLAEQEGRPSSLRPDPVRRRD